MNRVKMITILAVICVIALGTSTLVYFGVIQLNNPSKTRFPIRGVDVSSYQGDIDWQTLSQQGIQFAFIKATEGSTHIDSQFKTNLTEALKTDLRIGAYHFFSFDSSGKSQALHFTSTVPLEISMLPPVVDIEFYGDKEKNPPSPKQVRIELSHFLESLETVYEKKPIIYATKASYDLYIADEFTEYDIWIRDVIKFPELKDKRDWTFWQYTNRMRLDGYNGKEQFIDMNVFNGTVDDFAGYDMETPTN